MKDYHRGSVAALLCATALIRHSSLAAQTPTVRDSAGIRIVENPSRSKAPTFFTLATKPSVDIGGLNDNFGQELNSRNSFPRMIRLSDGRIVVGDVDRIQFFDATGKPLRIVGRKGGGPGEFQSISGLCATALDTVLVGDGTLKRVSVITSSGDYRRAISLPIGHYAEREFCWGDGTYFTYGNSRMNAKGERVQHIKVLDRKGTVFGTTREVLATHIDPIVYSEGSRTPWRNGVVYGDTFRHEFQMFDRKGRLTTIVRTDDAVRRIAPGDLEKIPLVQESLQSKDATMRADTRENLRRVKATTWPTYGMLLSDASGRLWMQEWRGDQSILAQETWTAFDHEGKLIGRMTIPAPASRSQRLRVVGFGKDELFASHRDEDGALHYFVYPITMRKP